MNTVTILQYEIEGIHDVEIHVHRHAVAFYNLVIPLFEAAGNTYKIIDRIKYYTIMGALTRARGGERLSSLRHEFGQIHNWNRIYTVLASGEDSNILVCPRCIERGQRTRPMAGLRPIITAGFNTHGQVDLIDFQSCPMASFDSS